jgi:TATA-box binding protein (TBP) (component of TFIID and TFIIIB)
MKKKQRLSIGNNNGITAAAIAQGWGKEGYGLSAGEKYDRVQQGVNARRALLLNMRRATPAVCEWLSRETYVLPPIVNIVYMMTFESKTVTGPLDLVRMAQYMPNGKFKPPNWMALTTRISPATCMLYAGGKVVIIRTTCEAQALYYSHMFRQVFERIPMIMKRADTGEIVVQTLEGHLECKRDGIQNMVGSGALPQDGVHLTKLLYADEETVNWDPGGFINLIKYHSLPSGERFCANIANTGKIVLMGLRTAEGVYEAYKIMCRVLHDFDDPNVPLGPTERHKYRMQQLEKDSRFLKADAFNMGGLLNAEFIGDEYEDDDNGTGVATRLDGEDDHDAMMRMLQEMDIERNAPLIEDDIPAAEPLLVKAALRGQIDNVRHLLMQPGPNGWDALWVPGVAGPSLLLERLSALPSLRDSTSHMQVLYLLQLTVRESRKEDGPLLPAILD